MLLEAQFLKVLWLQYAASLFRVIRESASNAKNTMLAIDIHEIRSLKRITFI